MALVCPQGRAARGNTERQALEGSRNVVIGIGLKDQIGTGIGLDIDEHAPAFGVACD